MKKALKCVLVMTFILLITSGCSQGLYISSIKEMKNLNNYKVDYTLTIAAKYNNQDSYTSTILPATGVIDLKNKKAKLEFNFNYENGFIKNIYLDFDKNPLIEYDNGSNETAGWIDRKNDIENYMFFYESFADYNVITKRYSGETTGHYVVGYKKKRLTSIIKTIFENFGVEYHELSRSPQIDFYIDNDSKRINNITIDLSKAIDKELYNIEEVVEFKVEIKFSNFNKNENVDISIK